MKDQLIIYASRWKSVLVVVFFSIAISMITPVLFWFQEDWTTKVMWIMWGFIFIYIGSFLRFVILNLLRREPVLIIDAQGIYGNASFIGLGHIKWEEISKIYTYRNPLIHMLCIIPRDYDCILSRQPFMKRIFIRMNTFMAHNFEIPSLLFDGRFQDIKQFIQKFFEITT